MDSFIIWNSGILVSFGISIRKDWVLWVKFVHHGAFPPVHEWFLHNINIPEVTWRPVSAWTRSLKPGNLWAGSSGNLYETGRFYTMVLRIYLVTTLMKLTMLAVGAWTRSYLGGCLKHFEPIMIGTPSSGFRVAKLWILIVNTQSVGGKLITIEAWRRHISLNIHQSLISIVEPPFKRESPGIFANWLQWIISSWPWCGSIRLHVAIKHLLREGITTSSKTESSISFNMHSKSRSGVIWVKNCGNIVSIRTWVIVILESKFLFAEPFTDAKASSSGCFGRGKSVSDDLMILVRELGETVPFPISEGVLELSGRGGNLVIGGQLGLILRPLKARLGKLRMLNRRH